MTRYVCCFSMARIPQCSLLAWLTALGQVHCRGDAALLASLRPLGITATPDAAEKEARNEEGQTPLLAALAKSQVQAAQYWIAQGANVNAGDTDVGVRENTGRTPLLEAIDHCPDMVTLLLAKHADPNGMTPLGDTPLKKAVVAGNTAVVQQLLAHGANPNLHQPQQHSPLYFARKRGRTAIATLLEQAGGKEE